MLFQVREALERNESQGGGESRCRVMLDYRPGEIEAKIASKAGTTVLRGTWTVQHSAQAL